MKIRENLTFNPTNLLPTWETYFAVVQFMLPLHARILPIPEMGVTVYDFQHMIRNVGQFVLVFD